MATLTIPERGSYQGQDRFVIEALGGMRGGFFLDSGASNGIRGSNSLRLEQEFGWTGICVEPNDRLFAELARNRRGPCLNCCLWPTEGEVEFLEAAGVYGGVVEAYDRAFRRFAESQAAGFAGCAPGDVAPVLKQARTIRSVLAECDAPETIDYWSLDTEGSELALLRSFPFDRHRVRVLTVEHNFTPAREAIREFLEAAGFRRVRSLGIDDGYVFGADPPRGLRRARPFAIP